MKGIYFILTMAAAALFAAVSCKVADSDRKYVNVAEEGYLVYRVTVEDVLSPVLLTLDVALKADMYAKADQYERYELEDKYFQRYKIRIYGDSCVLEPDYAKIVFDGKSITEPGAVWSCEVDGACADIVCTGENEWDVEVDMSETHLYGELRSIESMDMHVKLAQKEDLVYIVNTEGRFSEVENAGTAQNTFTEVMFSVPDSVKAVADPYYAYGRFHFFDGCFDLHLDITGQINRSEDIAVSLSSAMIGTTVEVTYMGEKGYWTE